MSSLANEILEVWLGLQGSRRERVFKISVVEVIFLCKGIVAGRLVDRPTLAGCVKNYLVGYRWSLHHMQTFVSLK